MTKASERTALLLLAGAFLAIRWPLFTEPGLRLGWNSDAALFGMMGRAMRTGLDFPPFFWGQPYLGTLTSMLMALIGWGPLALRIAAAVEVAIAIGFFWAGLRNTFGARPALMATAWLIAGPAFLFHFTIAPIGAEQLFFLSAILFWYATAERPHWWIVGLLCGFGMYLHQGVMFLIAGIVLAHWRRLRWGPLIAGALIGYLPALLALMRHDPILYRRVTPSWNFVHLGENIVETLRTDLWVLLADDTKIGIAVGLTLLGFAIAGAARTQRLILATIACSAAFWLFSMYPYEGAVRYIVPIVPMIYGLAATRLSTMRGGLIAALVIAVGLFVPRIVQVRDLAAARSELYTNWPGSFDPRPTLAALKQGGYRVCYGEVWVAHKLEFLSDPTVRFVPVRSVHRTLAQSLRLIREPGPKCYVDNFGNVRRLGAAEESAWAASVELRARKAGL